MKKITDLRTLNSLIMDEKMAFAEYGRLSKRRDTPPHMKKILHEMSEDELRHAKNLMAFKEWLKKGG